MNFTHGVQSDINRLQWENDLHTANNEKLTATLTRIQRTLSSKVSPQTKIDMIQAEIKNNEI